MGDPNYKKHSGRERPQRMVWTSKEDKQGYTLLKSGAMYRRDEKTGTMVRCAKNK